MSLWKKFEKTGYQVFFPGGLGIQWGYVDKYEKPLTKIYFQLTFPTTCLNGIATAAQFEGVANAAPTEKDVIVVINIANDYFTVTVGMARVQFTWMAIGF